jgi:hypothetical protein
MTRFDKERSEGEIDGERAHFVDVDFDPFDDTELEDVRMPEPGDIPD